MTTPLAKLAGTALLWKTVQLFGVKLIFLIRLLILARLLSPEDFGLLAIALTAIGFLLAVTDFGMVAALVQRSEANERHYHVAWTVGVVRALAITMVVICTAPLIAELFNEPRAIELIQVLAILPLLDAMASIKQADLTKNLEFRSLAFIGLTQALANTCVAIILVPALEVWALVAGALAGSVAYAIMSYLLAPYRPRLLFDSTALQPLIRYGRWIFVTGLVAELGIVALKAVISRQLGTGELGLYFLAATIAFLPSHVASEVAGSVAFPLYARLQSNIHQATRTFQAMLTGMSILLIPACALLIALAPSLVQNLLDSRWEGAAPIIQILALVSLIGLFGDITVPLLKGFGQPYKVTVLEIVQSLLVILTVWLLASLYGLTGVAMAMLLAITASQGISIMFVKQLLERPFSGLKQRTLIIMATSAIGMLLALGIDTLLAGIGGMMLAGLIGLMVMGPLLWILDRRFNLELAQDLARVFPQVAALVGFSPARIS